MADIVDSIKQNSTSSSELLTLLKNPMFGELQAMLVDECTQLTVPYTLVQNGVQCPDGTTGNEDLLVEEATLQAEFQQLAPLGNPKVTQLEKFFNTQNAEILTQRSDAVSNLRMSHLSHGKFEYELRCINRYYDSHQRHLTWRVSASLKLLKEALPAEMAQLGGTTKKSKSRLLNPNAISIMTTWYESHIEHPYPTDEEKHNMAVQGGIGVTQVKAWFANKRNRTLNTKPKRQQFRLQQHLVSICDKMTVSPQDAGLSHHGNYDGFSHTVSTPCV